MSDTDPLAFKVLNEIGIIDQLATSAFTDVLPRGMSVAQFTVLNHFVRLGHTSRSPTQLASAFQISRPTMTNTLARMERAGLVTIAPDPEDGRSKRVALTAAGHTMREDCLALLSGPLAAMQAHVPADLIAELAPRLARLREIMDQMRD